MADENKQTESRAAKPSEIVHVSVENKRLSGMLFIGDPHIEGRTPGFRRDDYPETILIKLQWCLEYADQHNLQPILLGDIFDKPRDNPNWIISRLLDIFSNASIPTIFGNHDCANPHLDENDSLTLLAKAGAVQLLDASHYWSCNIEGRTVVIGGSPYRYPIPTDWPLATQNIEIHLHPSQHLSDLEETNWIRSLAKPGLSVWLTHHDLTFPNPHEAVVTQMNELPGIDYLINGHIHRRASAEVVRGKTTWVNPGNIARRSRADSIRGHVPAALRMDVASDGQWLHYIIVPHKGAEEVFYDLALVGTEETAKDKQSSFITGLAMLQSRKTDSGAGLMQFLKENVTQFEDEVSVEILKLAEFVLVETSRLKGAT